MKKLGKFIFGTLSLAALAGGAFYFLKNFSNKTDTDDFDDFEDDFDDDFEDDFEDDFDSFDTEENNKKNESSKTDSREYVTINISKDTIRAENDSSDDVTADTIEEEELDTTEEE